MAYTRFKNGDKVTANTLNQVLDAAEEAITASQRMSVYESNIESYTQQVSNVNNELGNFTQYAADPDYARLSGRVVNVVSATTTAAVEYKGSGNGDTYRVTQAAGNTALRTDLIALCVKCPAFSVAEGSVEQVMTVEFIPSTADFALSIVPQGSSEAIASIPWVDGVTPTWQTGKVYSLCISRQGVSVSYRSVSSLYNE